MSRLPQVKTAVVVKDLIASLIKIRDAEVETARKETAAYKIRRAKFLETVRTHLKRKLGRVTPNFEPRSKNRWNKKGYIREISDWIVDGLPSEPECPLDVKAVRAKYNGLIAQLRLSSEPKIRLFTEDFQRFMAGEPTVCKC